MPRADVTELVVGSKNKDKAREMAEMLRDLPVALRVRSLAEFPGVAEVDETGTTFVANATLKAVGYAQATGLLTVADDSGLCVDALNGEPGVDSKTYAGIGCSYADNNRKLLAALKQVPAERRSARFISVIACADAAGLWFVTEGVVEGVIAPQARGDNGFGYDPVFEIPALGKTLAELSAAEKNALSHRGIALKKFRQLLAERLNPAGGAPRHS